jgi:transposase
MSITIGVDYHKRTSSYCILDGSGNRIKRCTIDNNKAAIKNLLSAYKEPISLAMEATRSWSLYYDFVTAYVDEFKLGHPKKMKVISQCETKNDTHDAQAIAEMSFHRYLPQAHVSSVAIRDIRDIVRYRGALVQQRRSIKNLVHSLIDRNIWIDEQPKSFKDLFCQRGMKWLETIELKPKQRFILDDLLASYRSIVKNMENVEGYISTLHDELPLMKFIRTVPGFRSGGINATVVLSEISDINRFQKVTSFVRYAGLVPREHSSAGKIIRGRLVKEANMHLRTALIESTLAAIRMDNGLKTYYKSVKKRSGSSAAVIATTRKLATALYFVLKEQRSYMPHHFVDPSVAICLSSSNS